MELYHARRNLSIRARMAAKIAEIPMKFQVCFRGAELPCAIIAIVAWMAHGHRTKESYVCLISCRNVIMYTKAGACAIDLRTVFNLILAVALVVYTLRSFLLRKRHIALIERGHPINGKIVRFRYIRSSFFMKTGECFPVVSFTWEYIPLQLKTISTVSDDQYSIGSDIELLYHPDYPKCAAIKGAEPTPVRTLWLIAALLALIFVVFILATMGRRY